jgi:hypothetical protein
MQSPPRSPFELSAALRILCALGAASIIFGVVVAPFTDRLRVFGNVTLCAALTSCAVYGLRTQRNRMLTALLLLIYLVLFVIVVQQYHHL